MSGEEGREVLVDRLKAPMLLAPAFLFAKPNIVPVEVTAVTDCVVWHINREAFFEFLQQEPTVLRAYLEANGSITSVADVAQQLGATRPSLSRVLSDMLDEGVITKDTTGYRKV